MTPVVALREHLGLEAESWELWILLVAAAFACAVNREERRRLEAFLRRPLPTSPVREFWVAAGRRAGKDSVIVRVAIFLALFKTWVLSPGEVGVVLLLAVDRQQVRVAFNLFRGALEANPLLWAEVVNITADCITLRNGVEIQVGTSDYGAVRGRTLLAVICDEFAFWPHEQAIEVLRAVRPGMATQPAAMLLVISSVYAAQGPFYEARKRYYGVDDPHVLYAVATTRELNPTIPQSFIDGELERDPASASAEYLSIERTDVASFLDAQLVDTATRNGPRELPRLLATRTGTAITYLAAVDVSGGRNDATAAAVAHREGDMIIVDACRRWPSPHDPVSVAAQVAVFLAEYGISGAIADQYGAELSRAIYGEVASTPRARITKFSLAWPASWVSSFADRSAVRLMAL